MYTHNNIIVVCNCLHTCGHFQPQTQFRVSQEKHSFYQKCGKTLSLLMWNDLSKVLEYWNPTTKAGQNC